MRHCRSTASERAPTAVHHPCVRGIRAHFRRRIYWPRFQPLPFGSHCQPAHARLPSVRPLLLVSLPLSLSLSLSLFLSLSLSLSLKRRAPLRLRVRYETHHAEHARCSFLTRVRARSILFDSIPLPLMQSNPIQSNPILSTFNLAMSGAMQKPERDNGGRLRRRRFQPVLSLGGSLRLHRDA